MKKLSLKTLGASLVATGLLFFAGSSPANAATIYPTVTATGAIATSGANSYPLTFTATVQGSTANQLQIMLASGWSYVSEPGFANCSWLTVSGITPNSCGGVNNGGIILNNGSAIAAGTTVTVTIPANTFNVGAGRNFGVLFSQSGGSLVTVDSGTAVLAGGVTNSTVTFNANGGSGSMANQTASSATNLTANTFTRSGYTFAGWATSATGTVAYADGASYTFTSSTTLYAVWTPTLATTGFDGMPYLAGGLALAVVGGSLMLIARRKASQ